MIAYSLSTLHWSSTTHIPLLAVFGMLFRSLNLGSRAVASFNHLLLRVALRASRSFVKQALELDHVAWILIT